MFFFSRSLNFYDTAGGENVCSDFVTPVPATRGKGESSLGKFTNANSPFVSCPLGIIDIRPVCRILFDISIMYVNSIDSWVGVNNSKRPSRFGSIFQK